MTKTSKPGNKSKNAFIMFDADTDAADIFATLMKHAAGYKREESLENADPEAVTSDMPEGPDK
jgi:hypothetical protein